MSRDIRGGARGRQRLFSITDRKLRGSFKVQADLDAVRMETAGPIQGRPAFEIMPFDTETMLMETGPQRLPSKTERLPDTGLGEWPALSRLLFFGTD